MTQWIGRYRLVTVVGTGAFATVHRAVDERLGDTVAVKVLAENHSLDPDVRERFISEGRVLRRVDSPHVVAVHDLGETERGQPYLVLEFADRGTLADRAGMLRADGWSAGVDDLLAVARTLTEALRAVHRADLVHRDLSPGNMLLRTTVADEPHPPGARIVGPDERLLVADLGLCKDLAVNSGLTAAGGTEGFRPPEQRGTPGTVDARADLWALSALLTWVATGHAPGARKASTLIAEAGRPRRLGPVLDTGLADDPAKRHPDVTTWLTAVEDALAEPQPRPPDPAPLAEPPRPPPASAAAPPPWRWPRSSVPARRPAGSACSADPTSPLRTTEGSAWRAAPATSRWPWSAPARSPSVRPPRSSPRCRA